MKKSKEKIKSSLLIFHEYQFQKEFNAPKKSNKQKDKPRNKIPSKKENSDSKKQKDHSFNKAVVKFKQLFEQKIAKKVDQQQRPKQFKSKQENNNGKKPNKLIDYTTQKIQNEGSNNKLKSKGLTQLFNEMQKKLQNYKKRLNQNKQQLNVKQNKKLKCSGNIKQKQKLVKSKTIKQIQKQKQLHQHYLPSKVSKTFSLRDQKLNKGSSLNSMKKNKDFISYSLMNSSSKKHNQSNIELNPKKSLQKKQRKVNRSKSRSKQKIRSKSHENLKKKRVLTETDFKKKNQKMKLKQFQTESEDHHSNIYAYLIQNKEQSQNKKQQQLRSNLIYLSQYSPKILNFYNQIQKNNELSQKKQNLEDQNSESTRKQKTKTNQKYIYKYLKTVLQEIQYRNKKALINNEQAYKQKSIQKQNSIINSFDSYLQKNNSFINQMVATSQLTPVKSIKHEAQTNLNDEYFLKMMKSQQQKWLKLKNDLDNLKKSQNKTQYLQNLIKQVNQNHSLLQNIHVQFVSPKQNHYENINLASSQDELDCKIKGKNNISIKKYEQAPFQIKSLWQKKKTPQQMYKQSQRLSMELSNKKLLQDMDLMNFISNNRSSRSLIFQSDIKKDPFEDQIREDKAEDQIREDKAEDQIREDKAEDQIREDKAEDQIREDKAEDQIREDKANFKNEYMHKQECNKSENLHQQDKNNKKQLTSLFENQSLQSHHTFDKLNLKQNYVLSVLDQQIKKVSQSPNQTSQIKYYQNEIIRNSNQKDSEINIADNSKLKQIQQFNQNLSDLKKQSFQQLLISEGSIQIIEFNEEQQSEQHNKIVQAFNIKRKQASFLSIFDFLLIEFCIQIVKSSRITYSVVDSYNKNVVQIQRYQNNEQNNNQQEQEKLNLQQHSFNGLKIKSDKQYIQLYARQILQYSVQNQEVLKRLNIPIGIKPLQCLKYMRYLEKQYDEDEEDFALSTQQYQNIISLQNIYAFQNVFDSQMSNNQQQFNQAICDLINHFLDYLRPFGKKGWPSICFSYKQTEFKPKSIKLKILSDLQKVLQVKLGILNFNIDPDEIEKILKQSLRKFSGGCIEQFQEQLTKLDQIIFQISFQIMNQMQNDIFMLISLQILQFMQFKINKH